MVTVETSAVGEMALMLPEWVVKKCTGVSSVIYKTIFVINIITYMYLQHSNVLCI